jgi:hypothetical protein
VIVIYCHSGPHSIAMPPRAVAGISASIPSLPGMWVPLDARCTQCILQILAKNRVHIPNLRLTPLSEDD